MANLRVVNRQIAVWYILYLVEVLPMFPNIKIYTNKMFANTKILWFLMSTNTLFAVFVL